VSNVPGPPAPVYLGGLRVTGMVPIAVGDSGNVTVSFACLSYAGTLTVTVTADPDRVPELAALVGGLQAALDEVGSSGSGNTGSRPRPSAARQRSSVVGSAIRLLVALVFLLRMLAVARR
jgi:hypothetical protein